MSDDDHQFADLTAEEELDARGAEAAEARRPATVISSAKDIRGDLRFRSPVRVLVAIAAVLGVAGAIIQDTVAIGYTGGGIAVALLLHGLAPVQRLVVKPGRRAELRSLGRSPMSLDRFRYARCFSSGGRFRQPTVILFYRRPRSRLTSSLGRMGARFLPGATSRRTVLFFSWWRATDGRLVSVHAVETLLKQSCRASGFEITELGESSWVARRTEDDA